MAERSGGPSNVGFVIAAVIALAGLVVGIAGAVRGFSQLSDRVDALQRVDVPGTGDLTFDEAGDFTIYYEAPGAGAEGSGIPGMEIALRPTAGGPNIPLERYSGSFTYSAGGHDGVAAATFRLDTPGAYTLAAESSAAPAFAQLAVGKSIGSALARIFLPMGFLVVALGVAAVLAIVTGVRRYRARRAREAAVPPPPTGPPPAAP